jgi:hypothetical protein
VSGADLNDAADRQRVEDLEDSLRVILPQNVNDCRLDAPDFGLGPPKAFYVASFIKCQAAMAPV